MTKFKAKGAIIHYCQAYDIGVGAPYKPALFPKKNTKKKEVL